MKIKNQDLYNILVSAKAGDENSKLLLIEKYKPLIFKCSSTYVLKNYDTVDLIQLGTLSVITSIEKYNLEKGGADYIDSYMITAIKNSYRLLARRNIRFKSESSLDISVDSGNDATSIADILPDSFNLEDHIMNNMQCELLKSIIQTLPPEEITLLTAAYFTPSTSLIKYCIDHELSYHKTRRQIIKILSKLKIQLTCR